MAEEVRTIEGSHILLRPVKLSVHSSATSGLCVARGTDSKCKPKVVHFRAKKAYNGNINITTLIVNLATGWRRLVHFTPRPLNFLEEPRVPLTRRLGQPYSRSGWFWENKNLLSLPRFKTRIVQDVAELLCHKDWQMMKKNHSHVGLRVCIE
jgi:hypothetical protein